MQTLPYIVNYTCPPYNYIHNITLHLHRMHNTYFTLNETT